MALQLALAAGFLRGASSCPPACLRGRAFRRASAAVDGLAVLGAQQPSRTARLGSPSSWRSPCASRRLGFGLGRGFRLVGLRRFEALGHALDFCDGLLRRGLGARLRDGRPWLRLGRALGHGRLHAARQIARPGVEDGQRRQIHRPVPSLGLAGPGDGGDPHHRLPLAMPARPAIALAADLLEHLDLLALAGLHQRGADRCALHRGFAQRHRGAFADHQHLVEGELGSWLAVELFDDEQIAGLDPVLFAAGLDHRVHRLAPWRKKREIGETKTQADGCPRWSRGRGATLIARAPPSQRRALLEGEPPARFRRPWEAPETPLGRP